MSDKITNFVGQLILDEQEADAAIAMNDNLSYAKFIITDDLPNLNKKRVPLEEFVNLIKSSIFMPFKMGQGTIEKGHENSKPIGVIAQSKQENNQIIGIAGLWKKENEAEIKILKDMQTRGLQPQISWEILYTDSTVTEDGIEELRGTQLRAATVVGMPAYAGRTPVLELASDQSDPMISNDMMGETETETEDIQTEMDELKQEIEQLKLMLAEKETELQTLKTQNSELAEFKAKVELDAAELEKFASIKTKFKDAGISKEDSYFEEKKPILMKLGDEELDFMVQELVSFSTIKPEASASTKIPNIVNTDKSYKSAKELAKALRESEKQEN
jgi:DNA gyrase/topoisomerase IV subunit A